MSTRDPSATRVYPFPLPEPEPGVEQRMEVFRFPVGDGFAEITTPWPLTERQRRWFKRHTDAIIEMIGEDIAAREAVEAEPVSALVGPDGLTLPELPSTTKE